LRRFGRLRRAGTRRRIEAFPPRPAPAGGFDFAVFPLKDPSRAFNDRTSASVASKRACNALIDAAKSSARAAELNNNT
jgi:hypothetical protein